MVVENQHINLPEELELMTNADSDVPKMPANMRKKEKAKKPKSIKSRSNIPVSSTSKDGVVRCPACEEEYCDHPLEEWIKCCKYQGWWHEECSNYENSTFICDYC
ncbi:uncharacterized protein TNCV_310131 [Trichonephila clavipes]|nr:uncharacterized protein TNCV_310131 [Trichonephila clavipes]